MLIGGMFRDLVLCRMVYYGDEVLPAETAVSSHDE